MTRKLTLPSASCRGRSQEGSALESWLYHFLPTGPQASLSPHPYHPWSPRPGQLEEVSLPHRGTLEVIPGEGPRGAPQPLSQLQNHPQGPATPERIGGHPLEGQEKEGAQELAANAGPKGGLATVATGSLSRSPSSPSGSHHPEPSQSSRPGCASEVPGDLFTVATLTFPGHQHQCTASPANHQPRAAAQRSIVPHWCCWPSLSLHEDTRLAHSWTGLGKPFPALPRGWLTR